jgi:V/A-type H+-transporting ATPase subunit D
MFEPQAIPTKGNLLEAKSNLAFARKGYALLDQKRMVLIREANMLHERITALRSEVENKTKQANAAVQHAHMEMGAEAFWEAEQTMMNIPDLSKTTASFDEAVFYLNELRKAQSILMEMENSYNSLTKQINKTNKRANALDNIVIPKLTDRVKYITDNLEERERDEFIRMKVVKRNKS